jgi:protein SDA1
MGGSQRDVTQILAYSVQGCHELVPPEEIHGLLQTIAHNFITERCSGEQMAVGINACRAICARNPSSLIAEDSNTLSENGSTSAVHIDVEAFARDLAGYSKHRDRSVAVAGRGWANFVREVHPSLLQGKDRGAKGSALARSGERPMRYGEKRISSGVAGADLLIEYEAKKAAYLENKAQKRKLGEDTDSDTDDDSGEWKEVEDDSEEQEEGEWKEVENDENDEENSEVEEEEHEEEDAFDDDDGWEEVDDEEEEEEEEEEEDEEEEEAPTLVQVKEVDGKMVPIGEDGKILPETIQPAIDLSRMTKEERAALALQVSSTRIFTAEDFAKMRKLVEREERAKRDPRAAARLKRRKAKGRDFEALSDDSDTDGSDAEGEEKKVHVRGAVDVMDIAAMAKRKRASKIERLEKIIAGRDKFEHKAREGGSTNTEKKRKKVFLMSKNSFANRTKQGNKQTARRGTLKATSKTRQFKHDNKKRRRKM